MIKAWPFILLLALMVQSRVGAQQATEAKIKVGKTQLPGFTATSKHGRARMREALEERLQQAGIENPSKKHKFHIYYGTTWPLAGTNKIDLYYRVTGNWRKSKIYIVASKENSSYITTATDKLAAEKIKKFISELNAKVEYDRYEEMSGKDKSTEQQKQEQKKPDDPKKKPTLQRYDPRPKS